MLPEIAPHRIPTASRTAPFYVEAESPVGPLSRDDLLWILSRVSDPRDVLVWREGLSGWQKVQSVAELRAALVPAHVTGRTEIDRAVTAPAEDTRSNQTIAGRAKGAAKLAGFWVLGGASVLLWLAAMAGLTVLGVMLLKGAVWASDYLILYAYRAAELTLLACLFVLLPLSLDSENPKSCVSWSCPGLLRLLGRLLGCSACWLLTPTGDLLACWLD